jgi:hypothetical protein
MTDANGLPIAPGALVLVLCRVEAIYNEAFALVTPMRSGLHDPLAKRFPVQPSDLLQPSPTF